MRTSNHFIENLNINPFDILDELADHSIANYNLPCNGHADTIEETYFDNNHYRFAEKGGMCRLVSRTRSINNYNDNGETKYYIDVKLDNNDIGKRYNLGNNNDLKKLNDLFKINITGFDNAENQLKNKVGLNTALKTLCNEHHIYLEYVDMPLIFGEPGVAMDFVIDAVNVNEYNGKPLNKQIAIISMQDKTRNWKPEILQGLQDKIDSSFNIFDSIMSKYKATKIEKSKYGFILDNLNASQPENS